MYFIVNISLVSIHGKYTLKILGIRTAPSKLRFAIITVSDEQVSLVNSDTENLIKVPAGMTDITDILSWQKDEIDRILRQNPEINLVALKTGEYGRNDTKSSRLGSYLDAIVILAATEANIPIVSKIYSQLATKRSEVKGHAEMRVGKTASHWNEQIADAIVAAWSLREEV